MPRTRIERVAREEIGVSGDTALRLGRYFGTTPAFWMNLQTAHDLATVPAEVQAAIEAIQPLETAT